MNLSENKTAPHREPRYPSKNQISAVRFSYHGQRECDIGSLTRLRKKNVLRKKKHQFGANLGWISARLLSTTNNLKLYT